MGANHRNYAWSCGRAGVKQAVPQNEKVQHRQDQGDSLCFHDGPLSRIAPIVIKETQTDAEKSVFDGSARP
jgi:hypothetical protein